MVSGPAAPAAAAPRQELLGGWDPVSGPATGAHAHAHAHARARASEMARRAAGGAGGAPATEAEGAQSPADGGGGNTRAPDGRAQSAREGAAPSVQGAGAPSASSADGGGAGGWVASAFTALDIVRHPLPGCGAPQMVAFSPDNSFLTYLYSPEGTLSRRLFRYDLATRREEVLVSVGEQADERALPMAERLRRERSRELGLGITRYEWIKSTGELLLPLPDGACVFSFADGSLRTLVAATYDSPVLDPQVSPDGEHVSFVRDDEVHVVPVARADGGGSQPSRQLTWGSVPGTVAHGVAEFIAQEEMNRRSGVAWSLDGRMLAYTVVDSGGVELFRIMHQGKAAVGAEAQEDHAYPFAGKPNVRVRLAVVSVCGGPPVLMDLDCGGGGPGAGRQDKDEEYLARFLWTGSGVLLAQVQNRRQTRLKLLAFDPSTGARRLVLTEESATWVNLDHFLTPLHRPHGLASAQATSAPSDLGAAKVELGGFLWGSERTGFKHLYQYAGDGTMVAQLTSGEYVVENVVGVDEERGLVYYMAAVPAPLEMHLLVTTLYEKAADGTVRPINSGPFPRKITHRSGRHSVVLDHALRSFVDVHDGLERVPSMSLHSLAHALSDTYDSTSSDAQSLLIYEPPMAVERISRLRLRAPAIVQLRAPHNTPGAGETLYAAVYRPDPERFGSGPYPTVVAVYGGPNVQHVTDSWNMTVDMRAQYLCHRGYLVLKVDNRGSARRGVAFESRVRHRLGDIEVADQVALVKWAVGQGLACAGRVGICGWSYGGYLAAMCLCRAPDVFRAAVAGAPVTSWEGYDTYYTERYMDLPALNEEGYALSSVMEHCANLEPSQKLLIVHGLLDENVHARHTFRLVSTLNSLGKSGVYELLLFPDERHMPRGIEDRLTLESRVQQFFDDALA